MSFGRILFVGILCTSISGCISKLMDRPQNTVVLEGTEVVMQCRTDNLSEKLIWRAYNSYSGSYGVLFTGNKIYSFYRDSYKMVTEAEGQFDLKFNASSRLSFYYTCEEPGGEAAGVDLIVLKSPSCGHNMNNDNNKSTNVTIKCQVNFTRNWSPNFTWKLKIRNKEEDLNETKFIERNDTCNNDSLLSTLTAVAHPSLDNFKVQVKLEFTQNGRRSEHTINASNVHIYLTADNIPQYEFDWSSPIFIVKTVSNISYFELQDKGEDMNPSYEVILIIFIVIILVICGNALICYHLVKKQKSYQIPQFESLNKHPAEHGGTENGNLHKVNDARAETTVPANIVNHDHSNPKAGISENSDCNQNQNNGFGRSKLATKTQYIEMHGAIGQPKSSNVTTERDATKPEYEKMNSVGAVARPTTSPPKPPRASQTLVCVETNSASYTGTGPPKPPKPPRLSAAETLEYVELDFSSIRARQVKSVSEEPMFSLVDVYASVDHNVRAPPPPSPTPPPTPPTSNPFDECDTEQD